ncbi:MAG TPA: hypothetical protein VGR28_08140 [Candidatus Thermoplasmatota archaeon]|jgi:hypothetical protein|nr:hypothetical protein [Candidatus Thermoplasmatota archaeon]
MPAFDLGAYLGLLVRDRDGLALGHIAHTAHDPATHAMRNFVVGLDDATRGRVGVPAAELALPATRIARVSADEVVLDQPLAQIQAERSGCWMVRRAAPVAAAQ